jgi:UDP-N-acetylmuramyl-tripeptide synthetase
VDGLLFDAAVFTNVTAEHLDYHKTLESYFAAKAKLFEKLKGGATAILNADDRKVSALRKAIDKKVLTYGLEEKADITADDKKLSLNGSAFTAVTPAGPISIETKLIGLHNISNILAAIGVALTQKVRLHAIKKGVESLVSVPGRLERVETGQPYKVLVDYAHTEDALYNILSILRQVTTRGIITVFGCGGDRDRSKRPLMGKVACRFSDNVIVTSDNPRSEEPRQIISEIEKGIRGEFANYSVVEDRREAIEKALDLARAGDIVVIAGKGHEKYQIIKGSVMPFDDCEVVRAAISRRYEGR